MLLKLDFSLDVPIYLQIRNQIVLGIANGDLSPGEKLPPIRTLASETGIYTMTVNKFLIILHFAHSVPSLHFLSFWSSHASCSLPSIIFPFPPFLSLFSLHLVCPVSCGQIDISK